MYYMVAWQQSSRGQKSLYEIYKTHVSQITTEVQKDRRKIEKREAFYIMDFVQFYK
jgi:hypothetical protein